MKFLIPSLLLMAASVCAQTTTSVEKSNKTTLSIYGSVPELNQVGLSLEFMGKTSSHSMKEKTYSMHSSKVVNLAYGMMDYDFSALGNHSVKGNGFIVDIGSRSYLKNSDSGLYMANYLSYGRIEFDDSYTVLIADAKFKGTYQYFSFFSPEIGYKIKAGPISIDPFAGIMWKLEVKGKGDVDNKNVEEWMPRFGLKLGMTF